MGIEKEKTTIEKLITENPETHEKLITLLQSYKIEFTQKHHPPTLTSQQSAEFRGSRLEQGAKAMLIRSKGTFVLMVMSAAKKLDMKSAKRVLDTKSLSFATESEVLQITKCVTGAVPPFGSLFGIQTYLDTSLRSEKEIDFNAGLRTDSVHMLESDYETIEKPIIVNIT